MRKMWCPKCKFYGTTFETYCYICGTKLEEK